MNVTQSNGSASLKCQLYPDKPSHFILNVMCLVAKSFSRPTVMVERGGKIPQTESKAATFV